MSEDIKLLAEEYFSPRTPKFNFKMLLEMVEEIYELEPALIEEAEGELSAG